MSMFITAAGRPLVRTAGVALTLSLLLLASAHAAPAGAGAAPARKTFESSVWKADAPGVRHDMAKDLMDSHVLIGKSREEVIALLGKPDNEGKEFLTYYVYSTPSSPRGAAYAIRVEFSAHDQHVHEVRVDTDTGIGDLDMN